MAVQKKLIVGILFIIAVAGCTRDPLTKAVKTEVDVDRKQRTIQWYQVHDKTEQAVLSVCGQNVIKYDSQPDCMYARIASIQIDAQREHPTTIQGIFLKQQMEAAKSKS